MKSLNVLCIALLSANAFLLKAQLGVPQVGVAHYPDGSVHLVRGIAASMIVDSHSIAKADAASFSDSVGLLSAGGHIHLQRTDGTLLGDYASDESAPLLHIDSSPFSAVVWLPSKHLLLRWEKSGFIENSVDDSSFSGPVTFVHLSSESSAQFFVTRPDSSIARVTIALPSGCVTSSDTEPSAHGWAFVQQGWTLSRNDQGLLAERANGVRQTIPLSQQLIQPGDLRIEQMSTHWLHVSSRASGAAWAIYLDAAKVTASLLPPPAPEAKQ